MRLRGRGVIILIVGIQLLITVVVILTVSSYHDRRDRSRKLSADKITSLLDIPVNFDFMYQSITTNKRHKILWFNPPPWIQKRHSHDFLRTCDYGNCHVSFNRNEIDSSSAVLFCPITPGMGVYPPVTSQNRNKDQVWISYSLEPPMNFHYHHYEYPAWFNTINWTMTYRFDSDIIAPYGTLKSRGVSSKRDYDDIYDRKTGQVAWIVSHCHAESMRDEYVAELRKFGIEIDVYGKCGMAIPPEDDENVDNLLNKYKFFISFENAFCKDYISCKFFKKYNLDLIQIVRGGADYDKLLPADTYINAAHFSSISGLADYIARLSANKNKYVELLKRKDRYEALDEDAFGYPYAMCEVCRKLNHLKENKNMYTNIKDYLQGKQCYMAKDIPNVKGKKSSASYYYTESK